MKRIIFSLIILFAFASCNSSKEAAVKEVPEQPEAPKTTEKDSRGNYLK